MALTRRERLHEATREEIKQVAREQMAEQGTAAISLRAIATRMEMRAPSLYNYFSNRDDLVTALIVDAFNSLAETLERASVSRPEQDIAGRVLITTLAYREWAVTHPTDFALISGNPIPGYHAPEDATDEVARRGTKVFFDLLQQAWEQHQLTLPSEYADLTPPFNQQFTQWCGEQGISLPVAHLVLVAAAQLQGLIMQEIYGLLQNFVDDPAALYRLEMIALLKRLHIITPETNLDMAVSNPAQKTIT